MISRHSDVDYIRRSDLGARTVRYLQLGWISWFDPGHMCGRFAPALERAAISNAPEIHSQWPIGRKVGKPWILEFLNHRKVVYPLVLEDPC